MSDANQSGEHSILLEPPLPHGEVAAFVHDPDLRAVVAKTLGPAALFPEAGQNGIEQAIEQVTADPSPRTLLVDITGVLEPMAALDRLAEVCNAGTRVIALGDVNDVGFYHRLRAAGVTEYLAKPVDPVFLRIALAPPPAPYVAPAAVVAAPAPQAPAPAMAALEAGPVVVVGARGGVGATMIAVALSWLSAEKEHQRTVLVDFDLAFGSAGLALDVECGRGFAEALARPDRIDSLLVTSATVNLTKNLFLLSSELPLDARQSLAEDSIKLLWASLRQSFQRSVFDIPRGDAGLLGQALEQAGTVVIVTDFSLSGVRDSARLWGLAGKLAPTATRLLVGNRFGVAKKGGLPQSECEKVIGAKFAVVIPEDNVNVPYALGAGKSVPEAAPTSAVSEALRRLAQLASGAKAPPPKNWVERLFS